LYWKYWMTEPGITAFNWKYWMTECGITAFNWKYWMIEPGITAFYWKYWMTEPGSTDIQYPVWFSIDRQTSLKAADNQIWAVEDEWGVSSASGLFGLLTETMNHYEFLLSGSHAPSVLAVPWQCPEHHKAQSSAHRAPKPGKGPLGPTTHKACEAAVSMCTHAPSIIKHISTSDTAWHAHWCPLASINNW
jgi:hypothetical protein